MNNLTMEMNNTRGLEAIMNYCGETIYYNYSTGEYQGNMEIIKELTMKDVNAIHSTEGLDLDFEMLKTDREAFMRKLVEGRAAILKTSHYIDFGPSNFDTFSHSDYSCDPSIEDYNKMIVTIERCGDLIVKNIELNAKDVFKIMHLKVFGFSIQYIKADSALVDVLSDYDHAYMSHLSTLAHGKFTHELMRGMYPNLTMEKFLNSLNITDYKIYSDEEIKAMKEDKNEGVGMPDDMEEFIMKNI